MKPGWAKAVSWIGVIAVVGLAACTSSHSAVDAAADRDAASLDGAGDDATIADDVPTDLAMTDRGPQADVLPPGPWLSWQVGDLNIPAAQSECAPETRMRPGDATIDPPRPVLPQSVSRSSSSRVRFRWILPAGVEGARIEICRDRCCTQVVRTVDVVQGTEHQLVEGLGFGVHFWRLFGKVGERVGARPSATWEFRSPRVSSESSTSYDTLRDMDGDGIDEAFMILGGNGEAFRVEWSQSANRIYAYNAAHVAVNSLAYGDFNGDGLAEVIGVDSFQLHHLVMLSRRAGMLERRDLVLPSIFPATIFSTVVGQGDINGDGYSDLAVSVDRPTSSIAAEDILFYLGSPSGLAAEPQYRIVGSSNYIARVLSIRDHDGDGYGDIFCYTVYGTGSRLRWLFSHGLVDPELRPLRPDLFPEWTDDDWFVTPAGDITGDGIPDMIFRQTIGVFHEQVWVVPMVPGTSATRLLLDEYTAAGGLLSSGWFQADLWGTGDAFNYMNSNLAFCTFGDQVCRPILHQIVSLTRSGMSFTTSSPFPRSEQLGAPDALYSGVSLVGDVTGDGRDDVLRLDPFPCLITTQQTRGFSCAH